MSSRKKSPLATLDTAAATRHVLEHDVGELMSGAEVVRERRPAKMITTLRIDLDIQAELEGAAAQRGIGVSTLMRQIIEEWVRAHRDEPAPDQMSELVRHLEAARAAADSLNHRAA